MALIGIAVDRLDLLGSTGQGGFDIAALVADECLLGIEAFLKPGGDRRARNLGVRALVPGDRKGIERRLRLPPAVGDDGNGIVFDSDDLSYALVAVNLGGVKTLQFAAIDGAGFDRGVEHAGEPDVDAVDRLPRDLVRCVEPLDALADDLPILRILEWDILGRLDLAGGLRDFAVGRGAI